MTTPAKIYQDVRFDELMKYASQNPHRSRKLDPIEIHVPLLTEETTLDSIGLEGYTATAMDPAGVLSILLCIENPGEYIMMQKNTKTQQLSEICTRLQTETDSLKNTSLMRSRKKLYELLAATYQQSTLLKDKDYMTLYHGIGHLRQIQFVLLREAVQEETVGNKEDQKDDPQEDQKDEEDKKGTILFSSDPTTWKRDLPVWIADDKGYWLAVPSSLQSKPIEPQLLTWLHVMEEKGWTIMWPEIDGTKVEIVEQLSRYPSWNEADKKLLKDVLSLRLGKERTLDVFRSWITA